MLRQHGSLDLRLDAFADSAFKCLLTCGVERASFPLVLVLWLAALKDSCRRFWNSPTSAPTLSRKHETSAERCRRS